MNYSLFNLVEALPVLPGPCQLLDWEKLKKYNVIESYFELLFSGDDVSKGVSRSNRRRLPPEYSQSAHIELDSAIPPPVYEGEEIKQAEGRTQPGSKSKVRPSGIMSSVFGDVEMGDEKGGKGGVELQSQSTSTSRSTTISTTTAPFHQQPPPPSVIPSPSITEDQDEDDEDKDEEDDNFNSEAAPPNFTANKLKEKYKHSRRNSTFRIVAMENTQPKKLNIRGASASVQNSKSSSLHMTEFLRLHMRLAEDRVLSFVTVFCTGYGTKW